MFMHNFTCAEAVPKLTPKELYSELHELLDPGSLIYGDELDAAAHSLVEKLRFDAELTKLIALLRNKPAADV